MSKRILVTGATGKLGKEVTKALTDKGFSVKAASTDPKKIPATERVEAVKLNYDEPSTFDSALSDVDGLFLIALPMDPMAPARLEPVINKAISVGLSHIVFISGLGVEKSEKAPLRIVERYIMGSGINYSFLRPNFLMENFVVGDPAAIIRSSGAIFAAAADGKVSFISARDVAEVAVIAFAEGHYGKAYGLSGPEALTHTEIARVISEVSHKKVNYFAITEEEMLARERQSGMNEKMARYMGGMYSAVRAGYMSSITSDVERLTGHKPADFVTFAREHASKWA